MAGKATATHCRLFGVAAILFGGVLLWTCWLLLQSAEVQAAPNNMPAMISVQAHTPTGNGNPGALVLTPTPTPTTTPSFPVPTSVPDMVSYLRWSPECQPPVLEMTSACANCYTQQRYIGPSVMRIENPAGQSYDYPVPELNFITRTYTLRCPVGTCLPESFFVSYPITLTADINNQYREPDEGNNDSQLYNPPPSCATATITPSPTRTNTVTTSTPQATATPYLDLQGLVRADQNGPCGTWTFYLHIFESNQLPVPVTTTAHLRNGHGNSAVFTVPPFPRTGYVIECTTSPCSPGAAFYDLTVDYDNNVHETNESNNYYGYSRLFGPPCTATRTATATGTRTPTAATITATHIATNVPPTATNTAVLATATQPPCTLTFSDVDENNTFYANIRCLACRGIISGYADGTFKPNNLVTRGQLAKIVSNAAGFIEDPDPQIFEDVPSSNTFYQWINRLARRGHMSGYACGGVGEPCTSGMPYFRPFANATRGQTSKIVSNAAGYTEIPTDQTFEDVLPTHTFFREIQRLASRNIMGGYPCGGIGEPCLSGKPYFRPTNDVTRGQSAKIVANTFYPGCDTP